MKSIGQQLAERSPILPPDPDDTKYSLIMHGLCKKYGIKDPLERHVFSIIENMSRGRVCLYTMESFVAYSGGSVEAIELAFQRLERDGIIIKAKVKTTNGWKLTPEVQRDAAWFKQRIKSVGTPRKSPN